MSPDDSWVFKYNDGFAGSVPPVLDMLLDYSKIGKFKELEEAKKKLEAYKVIFATVPRMSNTRSGNKTDNFAISSTELGKFVATVKQTLGEGVDFKAAPLEDFKAFDFSPSASEKDLLETEITNMLRESGLSDAILTGGTGVSANNMYKTVMSEIGKSKYPQSKGFVNIRSINKQKNTNSRLNLLVLFLIVRKEGKPLMKIWNEVLSLLQSSLPEVFSLPMQTMYQI